MERHQHQLPTAPFRPGDHDIPTGQRDTYGETVLTDSVLETLKEQSVNGCLLCSFDGWDEEEWD